MDPLTWVWVFLGGGLGSVARLAASLASARLWGESFPWGTLVVNVSGSFAIGLFASLTAPEGRLLASSGMRAFFMIGIFGGFTTFSSFSLQTLALAQEGAWLKAGANVVASMVLCLTAAWLGHTLATSLQTFHRGP